MLPEDQRRDTLNPIALKMNTTSNAVRTKNVNKQQINAEQTPTKTEHRPAVEWKMKNGKIISSGEQAA